MVFQVMCTLVLEVLSVCSVGWDFICSSKLVRFSGGRLLYIRN